MANNNGFPAGMDMNNLMKQAQKMQEEMKKAQAELAQKTFEITVGGGAIKIVMDGQKLLRSIEIAEELLSATEKEMLQDLIMSAINEGVRQAEEAAATSINKLTGGLGGLI